MEKGLSRKEGRPAASPLMPGVAGSFASPSTNLQTDAYSTIVRGMKCTIATSFSRPRGIRAVLLTDRASTFDYRPLHLFLRGRAVDHETGIGLRPSLQADRGAGSNRPRPPACQGQASRPLSQSALSLGALSPEHPSWFSGRPLSRGTNAADRHCAHPYSRSKPSVQSPSLSSSYPEAHSCQAPCCKYRAHSCAAAPPIITGPHSLGTIAAGPSQ